MKKLWIPFLGLVVVCCTEETRLQSVTGYRERLAVEAVLTDQADRPQRVVLTRTVPYFSDADIPAVSGARVTVSVDEDTVPFQEVEAGVYVAPAGFYGEEGKSYHLCIEVPEEAVYEADAVMPERGFRLDAVDYAYAGDKSMGLDSLWTLGIWGKDLEITSYYYVTKAVNGLYFPFEMSDVIDDLYFNGREVAGFPIGALLQTEEFRKHYGDCCKYLETGDVVTFEAWTLDKGYYDFLMSLMLNGAMGAIPLFSPQPSNAPTNIRGGDAVGYFAACPVSAASITVDDPLRPTYRQ